MILAVLCIVGSVSAADQLMDLMKAQHYSQAVAYVEQSVPASARTLDVWLAYAEALDKTQAVPEKITGALNEAVKKNPNDTRAQEAFGSFYLQRKNYQEAIKYYQKWFIIERNAKAAEGLAVCASKLKQWDKAQDAAESAVKLDPVSTLDARRILAEIYFNNKDYATAIPQLETIVQKDSNDVVSWKRLMSCYTETVQNDKIVVAALHVAALDKKDISSRQKLAEHYYFFGKKDGSDEYNTLLELSQLTPTDIKVFKRLSQICINRKQKPEAITYLRTMIKLDSTDVATYKALGGLLFEEKFFEEAVELLLGLRIDDARPVPVDGDWEKRVDAFIEEAHALCEPS